MSARAMEDMMMNASTTNLAYRITLCVLLVCLSIVANAQQVSVNYNHNQSFANYHTYAWGSNNTNQIQNSILAQVAQQDIENAMAQKGLQKVPESQNPD